MRHIKNLGRQVVVELLLWSILMPLAGMAVLWWTDALKDVPTSVQGVCLVVLAGVSFLVAITLGDMYRRLRRIKVSRLRVFYDSNQHSTRSDRGGLFRVGVQSQWWKELLNVRVRIMSLVPGSVQQYSKEQSDREKAGRRFMGGCLTPSHAETSGKSTEEIETFTLKPGDTQLIDVVHIWDTGSVYVLTSRGTVKHGKWQRAQAGIVSGAYQIVLRAECDSGVFGEGAFYFNRTKAGINVFEQR